MISAVGEGLLCSIQVSRLALLIYHSTHMYVAFTFLGTDQYLAFTFLNMSGVSQAYSTFHKDDQPSFIVL